MAHTSTARVLLSGLGADELLGGYSRHRKTCRRKEEGDWKSLVEEMQMVSCLARSVGGLVRED